jgi:NAD(P)-dependent dehydrogenase (short-subunit alcohol dehydrogenase family)
MQQRLSLDGQVAIVTGAGSGIGAAVARGLAGLGVSVVINDLSTDTRGDQNHEDSAAEVARLISESGGVAVPDRSSVSDPAQVANLVNTTIERFGRLDMLLNFAGIVRSAPLAQCEVADWDAVLGVHLGGHINCIQAALAVMGPAGYGRIVNVSSGAGLIRASASNAAYGTAKRAIAALTWELAGRVPVGVTINAISPVASTLMTEAARLERAQNQPAGVLNLEKLSSPEALVPLVAYICSDRGAWLNGRILFTNGRQMSAIEEPRLVEVVDVLPQWSSGDGADALATELLAPAAATDHRGGDSIPPLKIRHQDEIDVGRSPAAAARLHGGKCLLLQYDEGEESELCQNLEAEGWTVVRAQEPWVVSPRSAAPDAFKEAATLLYQMASVMGTPDAIVISSLGSLNVEETQSDGPCSALDRILRSLRFHASYTRAAVRLSTSLPGGTVLNVTGGGSIGTVLGQALAQLTRVVQAGIDPLDLRAYCSTLEGTISLGGMRELSELATFLWRHDQIGALTGRRFVVDDGWMGMEAHPTVGFTASTESDRWSFAHLDQVLQRTALGRAARPESERIGSS